MGFEVQKPILAFRYLQFMTKISILLYSLLVCIVSTVNAQVNRPDTTFRTLALRYSTSSYEREFHSQSALYNGTEYLQPFTTDDQHPFFLQNDWAAGTIEFMGNTYADVPLLYDLSADKVVTEIPSNGASVVLPSEKIKNFSISGHTFIRIEKDTSAGISLPQGFYDVLYGGASRILARRQKNQQRLIKSGMVTIYYEEKTRYYIFHQDKYIPLKGRSSIFAVLKNQKQTLKKYARENSKTLRRDREAAYSMLAEFYDKLMQ